MATQPTPWFRASLNAWYVQFRGKQVRLAKGKENRSEAMTAFYKLMAADEVPAAAEILVVQVCDLFLEWSSKHHKPETFAWAKHFLKGFCEHKGNGRLLASAVKVFHLTRWVDDHPLWTGARRSSQQVIKRAFSWAKREGLIDKNPFADVKLPPIRSRERLLTPTEQAEILAAVDDDEFRNFLTALQESGARPSEVAKVTAADVDMRIGVWVLTEHKSADVTGKPRVIYLSPRLFELTEEMIGQHPSGPLFPNRRGEAFNRNAIRCRFRRLHAKLPHLGRVQAYLYRHQYATAALEGGVGIAQVAELLGHTSTDMVMRHYGHLNQKVKHMREMAAKATSVAVAT